MVLRHRAGRTAGLHSDGVDVRISGYRRGSVTPLLDRRVRPDELDADGRVILFDGPGGIEADYLLLETDDRDTSWDWFEWEDITFR